MVTGAATGTSGPLRGSETVAGQGPLRGPKRDYPFVSSAKASKAGVGLRSMPVPHFKPRTGLQNKNTSNAQRTYAQVVKQNVPGWLLYTTKKTVYRPPAKPITEEDRQKKAKAKYGSGYRAKPPNRNRRVREHFLARNHKLARNNYKQCPGHVQKVLQEREAMWNDHPQGAMQRALLSGEAGLYQTGVIYALVNEETNFSFNLPVYIGQTVGHVVDRTQRHVDKAQNDKATTNSGLEPKIIEALRKTERWWTKWIMIPLETIPLPTNAQPGTQKYLEIFRASAIVREQFWIRHLKTGFPRGLNIEVHQGNPKTRQRRQMRRELPIADGEWQQVPLRRSHVTQKNDGPQPEFCFDETGLHFSTEPGHSASIRRRLEQLAKTEGKEQERQVFLKNLPLNESKRMVNWLTTHTPQEGKIQRIFQQYAVMLHGAHKSNSHATQHILQTYDATAPAQREKRRQKKEEAESFFWIKVPWRNNELQTLGMHVLINNPEIQGLYPIPQERGKVKISYNLAIPNGVLMQNYGKVSESLELEQESPPPIPPPHSCVCQKYKTEGSLDFHGHVVTANPAFIHNKRLRSYWLKGRKYRCQAHPQELMTNVEKSLNKFIDTASRRNKVEPQSFEAWKMKLLQTLREKCDTLFQEEDTPAHCFLSKAGLDELKRIHNDMVVTYADKSAHDFVLCCKSVYKHLLWEEIHSSHYEPADKTNEDIWQQHAKLSEFLGKPPVDAHRYLYGILKLHKNPPGVRWIAGNHMHEIEPNKKIPACSLSATEMALGGILRMCMHNLEAKDKKCRAKGYKRYWVVTNVDQVASDIKFNVNTLRGQKVFTRDFTRMYTSIPQQKLVEKVTIAIKEVFEWHSSKTGIPVPDLKVKVTYPKAGHARACFDKQGFSYEEILHMLTKVCVEVYFQQAKQGTLPEAMKHSTTRRQKQGLPMGGKASAELANLYCYAVEAKFIDQLVEQGQVEEAKRWYNTWRYIDDLLGFGERTTGWEKIDYGMEHTETTDIRYSEKDRKSQAVFLGMRIQSDPQGVWLSVQPKGEGWSWLPRRFIEYSSCHTHYTKWYMFKGLLIRALTICNNQNDFFKAAIHYAQGLIARGFPPSALMRAWRKFSYEKLTHPSARRELTAQFKQWLDQQDFAAANEDEETRKKKRVAKTLENFKATLMCGLTATNHILTACNVPSITKEVMQTKAQEMADKESALLYSCSPGAIHDLATDPRGNYAVDTLLYVIQSHSNLVCQRWNETAPITTSILLVGCGQHWQAVLKNKEDKWFIHEASGTYAVHNLQRFLRNKLTHGAVYQFHEITGTTMVNQADTTKRPKEVGLTPHRPAKRQLLDAEKEVVEDRSFTVDPPMFTVELPRLPPPPPSQQPLPAEFQAKEFSFVPSRFLVEEEDRLQMLIDAVEEDLEEVPLLNSDQGLCGENLRDLSETKARPKRFSSQPHRYQSEEEERKEKDLRKHSV